MAHKTKLTRRQLRHVKAVFRSFSGADALIDFGEWKQALGIKNDFLVRRIFNLVDADGTEFIDFDEFLVFAENLYSDDPRRRLEFIFKIYDLDGDGAIDRRELKSILEASLKEQSVALGEDVLKAMGTRFMSEADADRDGKVSLKEFVEVVGAYPGIGEQFSVYAADWLNEGKDFSSPRVKGAPLRVRLRRAWRKHRYGWLWSWLYLAANAALFAFAMRRYAAAGAGPAIQVARGAGACLNFNGALILVPVAKSFWTWLRRTRLWRFFPIDDMTALHRRVGRVLVLFSLIHAGAHLANYQMAGMAGRDILGQLFHTRVGISGVAITAILLLMARYSHSVKKRPYELFSRTHLLYGVWLIGLLLHGPAFWMWLALPAALFFLDAFVRWFWKTRRITVLDMKPLANGVTWLQFKKPKYFRFNPGDFLYLKVPAVSPGQWHPFTISAAPEAENIGVHVRNNGDWTGALHNLSRKKSSVGRKWPAWIDGPYGAPSSRICDAKVAVLVAAGIGVTPFASVLQSVLMRRKRGGDGLRNEVIHFHWLNRSQRSYEWFVELLSEAERALGADRFKLNIHLTSLTHDLTNIAMQVAMDAYHKRYNRDPMTGLQAVTSAGRPDWDPIFAALTAAHPVEDIEIFFCGPPALGKAVRKKCRKHGLIYHEEKF